MGIARLLAKGWVVFCLFAGAHAIRLAVVGGEPTLSAIGDVFPPLLLFAAAGLLFIGGYGASGVDPAVPLRARFRPHHLVPGFNELVFIGFLLASFVNQAFIAPDQMENPAAAAISTAVAAIVPGQRALEEQLSCGLDGGRVFSSAFAWILALVYIGSAVSRLKLTAGLIRLERVTRPELFGSLPVALVLGAFAIIGVQLLFVGSMYPWLPCSAFTDISGALLIGLAPLMLAYLIVAALASAMATGPE
jgi:hypothetical protein